VKTGLSNASAQDITYFRVESNSIVLIFILPLTLKGVENQKLLITQKILIFQLSPFRVGVIFDFSFFLQIIFPFFFAFY
jgi:hypothetical protein